MSYSEEATGSHQQAPTLDTLVSYFVAAKKSLSATTHVYQANEIVEDARKLVEEAAVLGAKNTYVRKGVGKQVQVLQNIHGGLETVGAEAQVDFQAVIRSLDVANDRLQGTLASLRKTIVSSSLDASPDAAREIVESADKEQDTLEVVEDKTLYDFVDESTHATLLNSLRATIDSYNNAQAVLHKTRTTLGDSLSDTTNRLAELDDFHPETDGHDSTHSTPDTFNALTSHATELASLLQSLISHYDLCITALKHTEGGGEAARAATTERDPLSGTGADSPTEASLYAGAAKEADRAPLDDASREEMLAVLAQDAAQVDDVAAEIRDRADAMRASLSSLQAQTSIARRRFELLRDLLGGQLVQLSAELLPSCVTAATTFREDWAVLRATLTEKTEALSDLSRFYDSFIASYASLLREVERRRLVEAKMEKIANRAMREIEALQAEDGDMRSQFVREVGEWLPRDIWPGLMDGPARWAVQRERGEGLGISVEEGVGGQGQQGNGRASG